MKASVGRFLSVNFPQYNSYRSVFRPARRRCYRGIQTFFIALFTGILLSAGCGQQPADSSNTGETEIDWGQEVGLDEMITMAREGRIVEIQWHVMPNILRAMTAGGQIYHFRNENKGVDLRRRLIDEGVRIGEDGVQFKHFF